MSTSQDGQFGFLFGLRSDDSGGSGSGQGRSQDKGKGKGRQRATMACVHCRRRKIRCDGLEPTCSNCQRLGKACDYEAISEEDNIIARDKKRASRLRKAQMSNLGAFAPGSHPLSIASTGSASPTTSPRYVMPSPGTPYGTVFFPDPNRRYFSDSRYEQAGPGALRRRGATVSTSTDLVRTSSSSPYLAFPASEMGSSRQGQQSSTITTPGSEEGDVLSSDVPSWARTTLPLQGSAWNTSAQPWQSSRDAVHQLLAHQSAAAVRRRSSVDDVSHLSRLQWSATQGQGSPAGAVPHFSASAVHASHPQAPAGVPAAAYAQMGSNAPAWLANRSISQQQLSRQQMLDWSRYFGDRSRFNSPTTTTSPLPAAHSHMHAPLQSAQPQQLSSRGSGDSSSSASFLSIPSATSTPADKPRSLLYMKLPDARAAAHSPSLLSPVATSSSSASLAPQSGQAEERRPSGGTSSSGSTSSSSIAAGLTGPSVTNTTASPAMTTMSTVRRFSGQDPFDTSGLPSSPSHPSAGSLTAATAALALQHHHSPQHHQRLSPGDSSAASAGPPAGNFFDSPEAWTSQVPSQQMTPLMPTTGMPAWMAPPSSSMPGQTTDFAAAMSGSSAVGTLEAYQQALLSHHQLAPPAPPSQMAGNAAIAADDIAPAYEDYSLGPGPFDVAAGLNPQQPGPSAGDQAWWQPAEHHDQQQQQQQQQQQSWPGGN